MLGLIMPVTFNRTRVAIPPGGMVGRTPIRRVAHERLNANAEMRMPKETKDPEQKDFVDLSGQRE